MFDECGVDMICADTFALTGCAPIVHHIGALIA
jgi:hypothetical protein